MSEKQGLVDLLTRIGDDRIRLQNVLNDLTNARTIKGGGTSLTFSTGAITPGEVLHGGGPVGLVLWLDANDVQAAREAFAAEQDRALRAGGMR